MGSPSPSRSTVPVTCPSCRHEGPAYIHLLGTRSRCKKCGHNFAMPRTVRMACPHCRDRLRVPAELIDCDVACKLCNKSFRADPARAESRRIEAGRPERFERVVSLERDLSRLLGEYGQLRAELGQYRAENDDLARRGHREIEELRAQLDRLAAAQATAAREVDRPVPVMAPAKRSGTPPSSLARHAATTNGHARTAPAHLGRGRQAAGPQARPAPGGAALREVVDRLASCEEMTARLLNRLKSAQEQRDEDRAAFARIIERLQDELTRARGDFGTDRVTPDACAGRDGKPEAIASTPYLADCGAA